MGSADDDNDDGSGGKAQLLTIAELRAEAGRAVGAAALARAARGGC